MVSVDVKHRVYLLTSGLELEAVYFSIDHSHERGVSLVRVSPLADWYVSGCRSTAASARSFHWRSLIFRFKSTVAWLPTSALAAPVLTPLSTYRSPAAPPMSWESPDLAQCGGTQRSAMGSGSSPSEDGEYGDAGHPDDLNSYRPPWQAWPATDQMVHYRPTWQAWPAADHMARYRPHDPLQTNMTSMARYRPHVPLQTNMTSMACYRPTWQAWPATDQHDKHDLLQANMTIWLAWPGNAEESRPKTNQLLRNCRSELTFRPVPQWRPPRDLWVRLSPAHAHGRAWACPPLAVPAQTRRRCEYSELYTVGYIHSSCTCTNKEAVCV